MDIQEFLLARIAEDEAVARAAIDPRVNISSPDGRWRFIDAGYNGTWPRSVELGCDDPEDIVWSKEAWAVHASRHDPARVLRECAAKREIIKQHEAWPVLVEQPLEFTDRVDDGNNVIFQASRKMAWLTEREYMKRFGVEPPTAPMIPTLAAVYSDHPDYQDEWSL